MARPKKDPADDKSERAADFIDIAAQHMAERGYDRTTVRDIAADMGLTSGSIFYHFRNKEELLEAIIRKGIVEGLSFTRMAMAQDMGPLIRFHTLVRTHLRLA